MSVSMKGHFRARLIHDSANCPGIASAITFPGCAFERPYVARTILANIGNGRRDSFCLKVLSLFPMGHCRDD
jgi:hypothetical protein